jgi:hypothetical protein
MDIDRNIDMDRDTDTTRVGTKINYREKFMKTLTKIMFFFTKFT